MGNYTPYHIHTMLSNGVTNIDSVASYRSYIDRAAELGMTAFGFAEHGCIFEWQHKKEAIEKAGMKYLHACEVYVTENLQPKVRDNYHCVLIARDYEGHKELNRLTSLAFNRKDGHYYYRPRISMDELESTSNHIIVTTACLAGIYGKAQDNYKKRVLDFLLKNKSRVFLEVQHHQDPQQVELNRELYELHTRYGLRLIAGTDSHAVNEDELEARSVLQRANDTHFANEENFDLVFRTYDELLTAYEKQGALPEVAYIDALENTNVMAGMVEEYEIDRKPKYPKVYDNPDEVFEQKIEESLQAHPYALKNHKEADVRERIAAELEVYKATNSVMYMLLKKYLTDWEKANGIKTGYGRGSVSGSMIAYILGVTDMDSMRFDLNFFRFLNPNRVSLPDIDTDYGDADRKKVLDFILQDKLDLPNIVTCQIITFNTLAIRGAIKDIGRGLGMPIEETDAIAKRERDGDVDAETRAKYPELFKLVDKATGTIKSLGRHAAGVVIADNDHDLDEEIGACTLSTSPYPVSVLNMKELDALNWVKWDVLGLGNVDLINGTCRLAGIDIVTPDSIDLSDMAVWKSIRDDTTGIFQWEGESAKRYLRRFMSDKTLASARERDPDFSMIKWMSFGNGLLRPACASYRDDVAEGNEYDNGLPELNEFLSKEAGHVCMQETIMKFLVQFCGYSDAESDTARRCVREDTLILMGDGTQKPIKDVKVGDEVISLAGPLPALRKVVNVFDNGHKETMKIKLDNGATLFCTPEHRIAAINSESDGMDWWTADRLNLSNYIRVITDAPGVNDDFRDGLWFAPLKTGYHVTTEGLVGRFYVACTGAMFYGWERIIGIEQKAGNAHVYDLEIEGSHNYVANGMIVHNCIAKKKGTDQLLPEIERRFIEYSSAKYNISKEKCAEVIKPFLQVVTDASSYAFSWNHSDAYSCIGYACGWLRYYYPAEFTAVAMEVFAGKDEKIEEVLAYAKKTARLKIYNAKFGHSRAGTTCDSATHAIYQGAALIKGVSNDVADSLYELRNRDFGGSFMKLLDTITKETDANSGVISTLISIDYFSDYGNAAELAKIYDTYLWLKKGDAKTMKRDAINERGLMRAFEKYCEMTGANGNELVSIRILDMEGLMVDLERSIRDMKIPDYPYREKIEASIAAFGSNNYATNQPKDRCTLYVSGVKLMRGKGAEKDTPPWGYRVDVCSIGTGAASSLTVRAKLFDVWPLEKGDVIRTSPDGVSKNKSGYWYLNLYKKIA